MARRPRPFVALHFQLLDALVREGSYEAAARALELDDPLLIHCCVIKALADLPRDSPLREQVRVLYRQRLLDEALAGLPADSPVRDEVHRYYEDRPR
jgi:hypothetical protein